MKTAQLKIGMSVMLLATCLTHLFSIELEDVITKKDVIELAASDIRVVSINNQKGNITIKGWEKDSIFIDRTFTIETKSRNTASEIIENIKFYEDINGNKLNIGWKPNSDYQINIPISVSYVIYVPQTILLKIDGSHGHLIADNLSGTVQINYEYGSASVSNILSKSENKFVFKSCNATLNKLSKVVIEGENNQIRIGKCEELSLVSSYCFHNIKSIGKLTCKGSYNKLTIADINSIELEGNSCQVSISQLNKYGLIEINKGSLSIEKISPLVNELNIANIEAPINLKIDESMPFFINGQNEQGGFIYPWPEKIRIFNDLSTTSFSGQNGEVSALSTKIILFNNLSVIHIIKE